MKQKSEHAPLHVSGPFAPMMQEYIARNRAIGNKCNVDVEYLTQFDAYCRQNHITTASLPQELMDRWCEKRPRESDASRYIRMRTMRSFARFLHDNGVEAPSAFHPLPRVTADFTPYIFTKDEISRFLAATKTLELNGNNPVLPMLLPLLFRVLYCCGLRIGEALKLKKDDVDLERGTLLILDSKSRKDRLVPISESLRQLCAQYCSAPAVKQCRSVYFFPAPDGGCYAHCTIYVRYRDILRLAGIAHGGRGKGPRIHDIRHTFAVHTLEDWVQAGRDIYVCLPILSAYLGHKNILATQQYLRLTTEAYPALLEAFHQHFGKVFPEVCYGEN